MLNNRNRKNATNPAWWLLGLAALLMMAKGTHDTTPPNVTERGPQQAANYSPVGKPGPWPVVTPGVEDYSGEEIMHCVSGDPGICASNGCANWYKMSSAFHFRGYHVCGAFVTSKGGNKIWGVRLEFCDNIVPTYSLMQLQDVGNHGQQGSQPKEYGYLVGDPWPIGLVSVTFVEDVRTTTGMSNIVFNFKDGTMRLIGPTTDPLVFPQYTVPVCGRFLGIACNLCMNDNIVLPGAISVKNFGACYLLDDLPIDYYSYMQTFTGWTMALFQTQTAVFETTELGCYGELFTFTCLKDGIAAPCPNNNLVLTDPVTLDYILPTTYSLNPTSFTDVGTWDITMVGQLTLQPGIGMIYHTFQVIITSDCVNTVLDPLKAINPMLVAVTGPTVNQDITWQDSIGDTTHANHQWCGERSYTFVGLPAFCTVPLNYPVLDAEIQCITSDPLDVGFYPVSATICLIDYPAIPCVTKSFTVTVTCTVTSLAWVTAPVASTTIEVGVTPQPHSIPWSIAKTPNCSHDGVATLTPLLPFISNQNNVDLESGNEIINGATLTHVGTHNMNLAYTVDGVTLNGPYDVIIKDPCDRAIIQTTPGIANMVIAVPGGGPTIQIADPVTDIELNYPPLVCDFVATLAPSPAGPLPAWITYTHPNINVNHGAVVLPTDYGIYNFNLVVDSALYPATVADVTFPFTVEILCDVTALSTSSVPADETQVLNQGPYTSAPLTVVQTPLCNYPYTYTHTFTKNGFASGQPGWLTFDPVTTQWTGTPSPVTDIGVYTITTTTQIPQIDPGTGANRVITTTHTITVVSDCTLTTFTDRAVTDMTYGVTTLPATVQNFFFTDTISTIHGDPNYCGPRTYTLTPTYPWGTFLTDDFSVQTSLLTDVGVYPVSLTMSFTNYPTRPAVTKPFTVYITCTVTGLTWTMTPPVSPMDTEIEVGCTPQPHDMPWSVVKTPNCVQDPTYTLGPANPFTSNIPNADQESGIVRINGAALPHLGTYPMTLTATLDLATITTDFTIIISDPCDRAMFLASPYPVANMLVVLPSTGPTTQTVTVVTDVEQTCGVVCPITGVLTKSDMTAANPWISWLNPTISINHLSIPKPTDYGFHMFNLDVDMANWPAEVSNLQLTFQVEIRCDVTSLMVVQEPATKDPYILNQGNFVTAPLTISQDPICFFPYTYTHLFKKDGITIPQPSWLTWDEATRKWTMNATAPADVGLYTIDTTTTIDQIDPMTGTNRKIVTTYDINVVSDCTTTNLTDKIVTSMTYGVTLAEVTQDVWFNDMISTGKGDPNYCGPRTYTLSPTYPWLTIDPLTNTMKVVTSDLADVGFYNPITLQICITNYPTRPCITKTFSITITCTVTSFSFTSVPDAYTAIEVDVDPQPHPMTFSVAKVPNCVQDPVYTISTVTGFTPMTINLDQEGGDVTIDGATLANIGLYPHTITAQVDAEIITTDFDVEIKDPCRRALFELMPNPIIDMVITMPSAGPSPQTIKVYTDVERLYPIVICPITGLLDYVTDPGNLPPWIDWTNPDITIDHAAITLPTDLGTHPFTLTIDSAPWAPDVVDAVFPFNIIIECTVNSLTPTSQAVTIDPFYLNAGSLTTPPLEIDQVDDCMFPYTYTHTFYKDGVPVAQPAWLTWDVTTKTFTANPTDVPDVGLYTIDTVTEINQIDPMTGFNRILETTYDVNVVHDCVISSLIDMPIDNMTYGVTGPPLPQDAFFLDMIAQGHADPTYCGPRVYTLSPVHPFMTMNGDNIEVETWDEIHIGSYTVDITVSIQDFPMVTPITKTFIVDITCGVQTLDWVDPLGQEIPLFTTLTVGIDPQPLVLPFVTTQYPNCGNDVAWTLTPGIANGFTTLNEVVDPSYSGDVTIDGAVIAEHGTYPYTLTGMVDGKIATTNFEVFVKDPCSTSTFELDPNPVTDFAMLMTYMTTEVQTWPVKIWTDVERATGIVCPVTCDLQPVLPYMTLSADCTMLTLDGSQASDLDVGIHNMELTVDNSIFDATHPTHTVNTAVYPFIVDLTACEVLDFHWVTTVTDHTYMLTDVMWTSNPFLALQNERSDCVHPITYTVDIMRDGVPTTDAAVVIDWNTVDNTFSVESWENADIGLYNFVVTASIPQVLEPTGVREITFTFDVIIISDCEFTVINDRSIVDMESIIFITEQQDVTFTHTKEQLHSDPLHCGQYQFDITEYPFMQVIDNSLDPLNPQPTFTFDVYTDDLMIAGSYPVTLTVSLPDWPMVAPITKTFEVFIYCSVTTLTENTAPAEWTDYYIGVDPSKTLPISYTQFPDCELTYWIEPGPNDLCWGLDFNTAEISIQTTDRACAGVYDMILHIDPRAGVSVGQSLTIPWTVNLIDLCIDTTWQPFSFSNFEVLKQMPEFSMDNYLSYKSLDTWAGQKGAYCGEIIYEVINPTQGEDVPDYIWVDKSDQMEGMVDKRMIVNFFDATLDVDHFSKELTFRAYLADYPYIQYESNFWVTLAMAGYGCLFNAQSTFTTGDPPMSFNVLFANYTFTKEIVLTKLIEPIAMNNEGDSMEWPSWATFDKATQKITVNNPGPDDLGKYKLGVRYGWLEYEDSWADCYKEVEILYGTEVATAEPIPTELGGGDTSTTGGTTTEEEPEVIQTVAPDGTVTTVAPDGTTTEVSPSGEIVVTKADGTIETTTQTADGQSVTISSDGTMVTTQINPDGSATSISSDGTTTVTVTQDDGSKVTTSSTGEVTVTASDGTATTTNPDGTVVIENVDGSTETINTDGTKVILEADGTQTFVDENGNTTTVTPDGSQTTSTTNPDGTITTTNAQGQVTTSDGTQTVTINPDGTTEIAKVNEDGSVTYTDAMGNEWTGPTPEEENQAAIDKLANEIDSILSQDFTDAFGNPVPPESVVATLNAVVDSTQDEDALGLVTNADGSKSTVTSDGSVITQMVDGTISEINADGSSVLTQTSKNPQGQTIIKETIINSDGTMTVEEMVVKDVKTNPDGSTTTTLIDGSSTTKNTDGSITETAPDGTKTTVKTNGIVETVKPDGTLEIIQPDGTKTTAGTSTDPTTGSKTTVSSDGTVTKVDPDGTITVKDGEGKITITSPDGTKTTYENGLESITQAVSQETLSDGSTKTTFKDGTTSTVKLDGTTTTTKVDGTITTISPSGKKTVISPDGTKVTINVDGTIVTKKADGSITTHNPHAGEEAKETKNLLVFNKESGKWEVDDEALADMPSGDYELNVTVYDSLGVPSTITVKVNVPKKKFRPIQKKRVEADFEIPPPYPRIRWIDMKGLVRIDFSRWIALPTFNNYPEFLDEKNLRQGCTNGSTEVCEFNKKKKEAQKLRNSCNSGFIADCKMADAAEAKLNENPVPMQNGNVADNLGEQPLSNKPSGGRMLQASTQSEEELRQALEIVNRGLVYTNNTVYPVMQLSMLPGSDLSDRPKIEKFVWEAKDFKNHWMDVQIDWELYPEVSIHDDMDLLQVDFIGREYFKAEDGQMFMESRVVQKKEVPQQIDPRTGEQVEALGDAISGIAKGAMIGLLFLGIFLIGIIDELFAWISKLQIIVHVILINVLVPSHTMIYFRALFSFIAFRIFNFRPMIDGIFFFKEDTKIVTRNLYLLGYESTYFLSNLGDIFILCLFTASLFLFIWLARRYLRGKPKVNKYREQTTRMLKWNGVFCVLRYPYIIFVTAAITNTLALTWENTGVGINNLLMFAGLAFIFLFPVWCTAHLLRNKSHLNTKTFFGLYSKVYEKLGWRKLQTRKLIEPTVGLTRVLLMIMALLYLNHVRTYQWIICLVLHFAVIIFNGIESPFKDRSYFYWQQINEWFIFGTILLVMTFADQIYDTQAFYKMGTVLNIYVSINIFINLAWIFYWGFKTHFRKYQIKYLLWKRDKLKESIELAKRQWELDRIAEARRQLEELQKVKGEKQGLSPRSLRIMNKVRKDLGLSYDSACLYDSCEVSFNSQADLVTSNKKQNWWALAGLPDELILDKNGNDWEKENGDLLDAIKMGTPDIFANDDMVEAPFEEQTKRPKKKKAKKPLKDNTPIGKILGEEYAMSNERADRMERFYKDNDDIAGTYDESFARAQSRDEIDNSDYNRPPTANRTAGTTMYDGKDPNNFDNFNKWYNTMLNQPQDEDDGEWGDRQPYNKNILGDNYYQNGDPDDDDEHDSRVRQRQEGARQNFRSPGASQDDFWRDDDDRSQARDPKNGTGLVSIKTGFGDQKVSIFPARRPEDDDNDQWGNQ